MEKTLTVFILCFLVTSQADWKYGATEQKPEFANNGFLIDGSRDEKSFALFRMGVPVSGRTPLRNEVCNQGITEVLVLSGDGEKIEGDYIPCIKRIYDFEQSVENEMSRDFLSFFIDWVEKAKTDGKKIAFRCSCGCHRTGRLAAFYAMYKAHLEGKPLPEVRDLMKDLIGKAHNLQSEIFAPLEREISSLRGCLNKNWNLDKCARGGSKKEVQLIADYREKLNSNAPAAKSASEILK